MKDYLGKEVKVGDEIIYPLFKGGVLSYGHLTVEQISTDQIKGFNRFGRRNIIKRISTIIRVEK